MAALREAKLTSRGVRNWSGLPRGANEEELWRAARSARCAPPVLLRSQSLNSACGIEFVTVLV